MIFGMISQLATAKKQKKLSEAINPEWKKYQESGFAKDRLGLAQSRLNSRMAGAGQLERNVQQNQANTMGSVMRNATDGSTAIAAAMATQGATNQAMNNLQLAEEQNQAQKDAALSQAQGIMTNEQDKVYSSEMDKYREDRAAKDALMNASLQNKAGAFDGLDQALGMAAGMVMGNPGALKGIFGRKKPRQEDKTVNYTGNKSIADGWA